MNCEHTDPQLTEQCNGKYDPIEMDTVDFTGVCLNKRCYTNHTFLELRKHGSEDPNRNGPINFSNYFNSLLQSLKNFLEHAKMPEIKYEWKKHFHKFQKVLKFMNGFLEYFTKNGDVTKNNGDVDMDEIITLILGNKVLAKDIISLMFSFYKESRRFSRYFARKNNSQNYDSELDDFQRQSNKLFVNIFMFNWPNKYIGEVWEKREKDPTITKFWKNELNDWMKIFQKISVDDLNVEANVTKLNHIIKLMSETLINQPLKNYVERLHGFRNILWNGEYILDKSMHLRGERLDAFRDEVDNFTDIFFNKLLGLTFT